MRSRFDAPVESVASRAQAAIYQLMLREAGEGMFRRLHQSENRLQAIADQVNTLEDDIRALVPAGVELECEEGGQPAYWWLLAAE